MRNFEQRIRERLEPAKLRRTIRYATAALSGATAALYVLIGLEIVSVVGPVPDGDPSLLFFGITAGAAFALGAVLLVAFDRRVLWVLGAVFQLLTITLYFEVAPQRTPPYEPWGVGIKVAQSLILLALLYLSVRPSARPSSGPDPALTGVK